MAARFRSFLDDYENREVTHSTFLDQTGTEADQECILVRPFSMLKFYCIADFAVWPDFLPAL